VRRRRALFATAATAATAALALAWPLSGQAQATQADFGAFKAPAAVKTLADWIVRSGDHRSRSFALLDKRDAQLYVFEPDGRLQARSAVLLGYARGDHTVPGIGDRPLDQVRPEERTTPAGRFLLEAGRNTHGEDILWVDYDAAVSIHRLRANNPTERRVQRMQSPSSADNRISYGCINVPVPFYDAVMKPAFSRTAHAERGVLYILPEVLPLSEVFPGLEATVAR
jgi:hypothetical protein